MLWLATQTIISHENLGTEVSQVHCDIIPEGLKLTRTVNLCLTETSFWQGKWETKVEGSPVLMCNKITIKQNMAQEGEWLLLSFLLD